MDDSYLEYNASANTSDASACETLAVLGCMNDQYTEYNANANVDSDPTLCQTLIVQGCTDLNLSITIQMRIPTTVPVRP